MVSKAEWTWTDGWLLMALFLAAAERSAPLTQIIGSADAINHAIPTSQELSNSFTKFIQCGLITVAGDLYQINQEFVPDIRKAYQGRGGLFTSGDKGLKFLKRSKLLPKDEQDIILTDQDVKEAYELYSKAIREK